MQSRMCGVVSLLLLQLQKTLMQHLYCAVVVINYINTQLCQGNCCWWRFRGHSACSFTHQHDNTPVEDSSVVTVATGWAQERLLQDVTAARKQTFNSRLIFFSSSSHSFLVVYLCEPRNLMKGFGHSQTHVKERFNCRWCYENMTSVQNSICVWCETEPGKNRTVRFKVTKTSSGIMKCGQDR